MQTHALVANVTHPFVAIDKVEAEQLGNATADLMEIYGVPEMAPETIAWGAFIQACAFIYGSRVIAIRNDMRSRASKKAQPATAENSRGSTTPQADAPQPPPAAQPLFRRQHIEGLGEIDVPLTV